MNSFEYLSILSRFITKIQLSHFKNMEILNTLEDIDKYLERNLNSEICGYVKSRSLNSKIKIEYEWIHKKGFVLLYPYHPYYPKEFMSLERPVLFLTAYGNLESLMLTKFSVVGSRYPTERILEWMDACLPPLVKKDYIIVSGAARGVDQKAHSISLSYGKPTIAFLPSGLDQIYPKCFGRWQEKILENGGLLLSEYLPQQTIFPHHFHERNRMIAKLSLMLLVCEARRKSGSIMTARLAIENNITVGVIPGFPNEKNSMGCLDLLFQGAFPIRDSEDLRALLELEKTHSSRSSQRCQMSFNV